MRREEKWEKFYDYLWHVFGEYVECDELVYLGNGIYQLDTKDKKRFDLLAKQIDSYNFDNLPIKIININGEEYIKPFEVIEINKNDILSINTDFIAIKLHSKTYKNYLVLIKRNLYDYENKKVKVYLNRFYELYLSKYAKRYCLRGIDLIKYLTC